jgi:hypothetical protein
VRGSRASGEVSWRRRAVDRGVVHAQQDREAALRQPGHVIEALDHVHLPQRAREIEVRRGEPRGQDAELTPVARLGQPHVMDVMLDLELRVLDPIGTVEIEGNAMEPAPEHGQLGAPRFDVPEDLLEAQRLPERALVVDEDQGGTRAVPRAVEVEEDGVGTGELLHTGPHFR